MGDFPCLRVSSQKDMIVKSFRYPYEHQNNYLQTCWTLRRHRPVQVSCGRVVYVGRADDSPKMGCMISLTWH